MSLAQRIRIWWKKRKLLKRLPEATDMIHSAQKIARLEYNFKTPTVQMELDFLEKVIDQTDA